jgi:O-antigen ligase
MSAMTLDARAMAAGYAALFFALVAFDPIAYEPHHVRWIAAAVFVFALAKATGGLTAAPLMTTDAVVDGAVFLSVGLAAASLFWSADPASGTVGLGQFLVAALLFHCARKLPRAQRGTIAAIVASTVPVVLALWWLGIAEWGGIGNPNFLTETLLLAAPFAAVAAAAAKSQLVRIWYASCGVGALGICVFVLPSQAGTLGAAAMLGVFVLACLRGRLLIGAAAAAALGVFVVLSFGIDAARFSNSLASRTQLWSNAAAMWRENPVFGIGFGSFDALYPSYQERHLAGLAPTAPASVLLDRKNIRAGAVHNEPLQYLATLGLVGAALVGAFAVAWSIGVARANAGPAFRAENAAALAGIAGLSTVALVGFPLQMPQTQIMAALLLAFALPIRALDRQLPAPRSIFFASSAALFAIALHCASTAIGQHMLGRSLATMPTAPERATALAETARLFAPADPAVRAWAFVALVRWSELDPERIPERARIDRAYSTANAPPNSSLLVQSARLQYLVNFGETDADIAEATAISAWLAVHASRIQDSWILAAALEMRKGDFARARDFVEIASGLRRADATDGHRALIDAMRAAAAAAIASNTKGPLRPRINVVFDRV